MCHGKIMKRFQQLLLGLGMFVLTNIPALASTISLADVPLFSTVSVPGNLALVLSVEYPTALSPAYLSTTTYTPSTTFIGYFDPAKCYRYVYNATTPLSSYFTPNSAASSHVCSTTSSVPLWSGNYLNYVAMQSLDTFRWVLTGGSRVVDTTSQTILEKTNHSGQGTHSSETPDKTLTSSYVAGATPFTWSSVTTSTFGLQTIMSIISPNGSSNALNNCTITTTNSTSGSKQSSIDVYSCTNLAANAATCSKTTSSSSAWSAGTSCTTSGAVTCTRTASSGTYTYTCTGLSSGTTTTAGSCTATATYSTSSNGTYTSTCSANDYNGQSSTAGTAANGSAFKVVVRVKVCDSSVGVESNCTAYGSNYKPEGLMQKYDMKLRYAAFGYLNNWLTNKDGGVLRASMKFIGPTKPVPGSADVTNSAAEWSSSTGIMVQNPDSSDATATTAASGVTINYSGVTNYLNLFGKIVTSKGYKKYDPTSELYYTAIRYFRNQGNVAAYSSLASPGDGTTTEQLLDGFPVISSWTDPIAYYCQKNFILGIGDVNTNYDGDLPGSLNTSGGTIPSDSVNNVNTSTAEVGTLEGISGLATKTISNGRYFIAGLAYDAHTTDIRSDLADTQTINTYWLDVMEYQTYVSKNQYWLATKYGGFTVPDGFSPYATTNGTTTLTTSSWSTSGDTIGSDNRPDNYFQANQADTMKSGLTSAFEKIVSEASAASSTVLSSPSAIQATSGSINYTSNYDPEYWTGYVKGRTVAYDASGNPTYTDIWNAQTLLDARTTSRLIVTCCTSAGAGLPFEVANLAAGGLSSRTYYASFANVPGIGSSSQSASNYVAYLRGTISQELPQSGTDTTRTGVYRYRKHLLGDIVNSGLTPVAAPSQPYWDMYNPGYASFKSAYSSRKTVVYVGSNSDGMLHAFDGTITSVGTGSGQELFAYIPSFLYGDSSTATTTGLAALGNPTYTHYYMVDSTPISGDVDFVAAPTATNNDWHTILVGGLGKGGKGYYALDVTNPGAWTSETAVSSKVLWEYTNTHMGYSYGTPLIIKTAKYGWVVVLTSGYNNDDGKGYFFFIKPETGALLETVVTSDGSTSTPLNLAYTSSFIPSAAKGLTDAIYAGDLQGNLWRVDVTSSSASYTVTKIAKLTSSSGTAQPVTTNPIVAEDSNSNKRYVIVGTGRLLADSDITSTDQQSFYAIIDGTGASGDFYTSSNLPSGTSFPITRSDLEANTDLLSGIGSAPAKALGWYWDLPIDSTSGYASRITVQPIYNNGILAFTETIPSGSACSPRGTSNTRALSLTTGLSVLTNSSGTLVAGIYSDTAVVNLAFYSVGGTVRLLAGTTSGEVSSVSGNFTSSGTLKRLNWRVVPTVD
jgi:type IV pilus assembly protein PilY1